MNMKEWLDCKFEERASDSLVICSKNALIFPKGAFASLGIDEVTDVKLLLSSDYDEFQYLINLHHIVRITGGSCWHIEPVTDIIKWERAKKEFGQKILFRAKKACVPWHIARLSEFIEDDTEACNYLSKLRRLCVSKELEQGIKSALESKDFGARIYAIEKFLGMEVILPLKYKYREDSTRYLAWYILSKGKLILDINENCKLKLGRDFSPLYHTRLIRSIEANVPAEIAKIFDNVQDDYDAIYMLKKIKKVASDPKVGSANMISNFEDLRMNEFEKIFDEETSKIMKKRFESNAELSLKLGYYILNDGN